jgi:hypothetical protein
LIGGRLDEAGPMDEVVTLLGDGVSALGMGRRSWRHWGSVLIETYADYRCVDRLKVRLYRKPVLQGLRLIVPPDITFHAIMMARHNIGNCVRPITRTVTLLWHGLIRYIIVRVCPFVPMHCWRAGV